MHEKCCCGCCTLYAGTSVALAFTATEAIVGILINVELLLLLSDNGIFNPSIFLINITTVEEIDVFHGIVLAAIGLNGFWFVFSIFAAAGNIYQSHGRLTPWILLTYLISLFEFGATIYFGIKFQGAFSEATTFYDGDMPTKTLTYLTLLCIYSGGGIFLILKFFFVNVVERRGKEIDHDFSTLALYILSNMGRCSHVNDEARQNLLPEAPPSYRSSCPPYLPPEIYQRINESGESSWSLSYEALKRIRAGEVNPIYDPNSLRRNVLTAEHLNALINTEDTRDYQPLEIDSHESSALPY